MNEENKISVVINTYNAEKYLRECLEAVKDFDELVVCDMESTDRTVSIAQHYGCRIVTFPKRNYNIVEPARTFALQSATNKWVLVVDADEIVTPELRSAFIAILHSLAVQRGCSFPGRISLWVCSSVISIRSTFCASW